MKPKAPKQNDEMNRQDAIDANCYDCLGLPDDAFPCTWQQRVTLCGMTKCPFWLHRPVRTGRLPKALKALPEYAHLTDADWKRIETVPRNPAVHLPSHTPKRVIGGGA